MKAIMMQAKILKIALFITCLLFIAGTPACSVPISDLTFLALLNEKSQDVRNLQDRINVVLKVTLHRRLI